MSLRDGNPNTEVVSKHLTVLVLSALFQRPCQVPLSVSCIDHTLS